MAEDGGTWTERGPPPMAHTSFANFTSMRTGEVRVTRYRS